MKGRTTENIRKGDRKSGGIASVQGAEVGVFMLLGRNNRVGERARIESSSVDGKREKNVMNRIAVRLGRLSMGREVGTGHEWEKQVGGWNSVWAGTIGR